MLELGGWGPPQVTKFLASSGRQLVSLSLSFLICLMETAMDRDRGLFQIIKPFIIWETEALDDLVLLGIPPTSAEMQGLGAMDFGFG